MKENPESNDIDELAAALEKIVLDDMCEAVWDGVSYARVLMNLAARLERRADELVTGKVEL